MTRLQRKSRLGKARNFHAVPRRGGGTNQHANHNNSNNNDYYTSSTYYSDSTTPIKVWSSHPIRKLTWTTTSKRRNEADAHSIPTHVPIPIDHRTERAMQVEVEDFLRDKGGSCSLMEAASALAGSNRVRDMYAANGNPSSEGRRRKSNNSNDTATGGGGGWFQSIKSWFGGSSGNSRRRSTRPSMKRNQESVWRRLTITNAFSMFEKSENASNIRLNSWQKAREIFSSRFLFPERRDMELEDSYPQDQEYENDTGLFGKNNYLTPKLTVDTTTGTPMDVDSSPRYRGGRRRRNDKYNNFIAEEASFTPSHQRWRTVKVPERDYKKEEEERRLAEEQQRQAEAQRRAEEEARLQAEEQERLELEQQQRAEEARQFASSLLRDFTEEEEAIIHQEIYGEGPEDEVMHLIGPDSVQRGSLNRLKPRTYLNDEVIHYFYVMLGKRDEELCRQDHSRKRSHFFKSFFMTKLLNEGHTDPAKDGEYEYRNVKRWSKKAPGKDIFNLDKIFFPININNAHWICAVAFMQEKKIQIYDSLGGGGMEYLECIFRYLQDEHMDKKKSPLPDKEQWTLIPCTADTPRQANGYDCGVFTCMFADFVSKDCPVLFNQEHITLCRKRIALSISQGKAII